MNKFFDKKVRFQHYSPPTTFRTFHSLRPLNRLGLSYWYLIFFEISIEKGMFLSGFRVNRIRKFIIHFQVCLNMNVMCCDTLTKLRIFGKNPRSISVRRCCASFIPSWELHVYLERSLPGRGSEGEVETRLTDIHAEIFHTFF